MAEIPFLANPVGPPWLPASVAESRKLAYWGQIAAAVLGIILLILGVVDLLVTKAYIAGAYELIAGFIGLAIAVFSKTMLFGAVDQGKFKEASDHMLIFGILGLFVAVIPAILLILAYLRIQEVFQPQYQQYKPQQASTGPAPQQPTQPAYQPPAQSQPDQMQELKQGIADDQAKAEQKKKEQKTEMIKCNKCGVQFPSFMHACPNCNEPKGK